MQFCVNFSNWGNNFGNHTDVHRFYNKHFVKCIISESTRTVVIPEHSCGWDHSLVQKLCKNGFDKILRPEIVAQVVSAQRYPDVTLGFFNWTYQKPNYRDMRRTGSAKKFDTLNNLLRETRNFRSRISLLAYCGSHPSKPSRPGLRGLL